jgi:3-hydroxyisobutyrate dehydrogenase-like beta-hydroxyacid dehydrogenase
MQLKGTARHVGMVGAGLMGDGIASSLLKAGHSFTFLDHPGNQPVDELLAARAESCACAREVAEGTGILGGAGLSHGSFEASRH